MLVTSGATYAVLFREEKFRRFLKEINNRPELTHVWLVTDSEDAFAGDARRDRSEPDHIDAIP